MPVFVRLETMPQPLAISVDSSHHVCVLALTLVSLLHRRVHQAGVPITQSRLIEQLKRIKEITNYYPAQTTEKLPLGGRPRSERALTRLDSQQDQIFRALQLDRFRAS
jgi:hypothetical protein